MLGVPIPLGLLVIGDSGNVTIRGIVGTYNDYSTGVAYANAFAVLDAVSSKRNNDNFVCHTFIYSSEQAFLSEYRAIGHEVDSIPITNISQSQGIFNALYDELLKLSHFSGFVAV